MNFEKKVRPERVIQFGEGGFLRGFFDWMLQKINENSDFDGSVVVVQPIESGTCDLLSSQNCVYTHIIRGIEGVDKTVIDVISRCVKPYDDFESYLKLAEQPELRFIVSNTTEAGFVYLRARYYDPNVGRFTSADTHWNPANAIYGFPCCPPQSRKVRFSANCRYINSYRNKIKAERLGISLTFGLFH